MAGISFTKSNGAAERSSNQRPRGPRGPPDQPPLTSPEMHNIPPWLWFRPQSYGITRSVHDAAESLHPGPSLTAADHTIAWTPAEPQPTGQPNCPKDVFPTQDYRNYRHSSSVVPTYMRRHYCQQEGRLMTRLTGNKRPPDCRHLSPLSLGHYCPAEIERRGQRHVSEWQNRFANFRQLGRCVAAFFFCPGHQWSTSTAKAGPGTGRCQSACLNRPRTVLLFCSCWYGSQSFVR